MGDFRLILEKTQYCETIEITEKVYNRNSCIEYVMSSPKFSMKRWLSLTLFFNTVGILLNLHSQVNFARPKSISTSLLFTVIMNRTRKMLSGYFIINFFLFTRHRCMLSPLISGFTLDVHCSCFVVCNFVIKVALKGEERCAHTSQIHQIKFIKGFKRAAQYLRHVLSHLHNHFLSEKKIDVDV